MLAGIRGARDIDDPLGAGRFALAFVDALGMVQRVGIDQALIQIFFGGLGVDDQPLVRLGFDRAGPVGFKRLGAIAPPRINAVDKQSPAGLFPIHGAGFGIKCVHGGLVAEHEAAREQFLLVFAAVGHDRPD